MLSTESVRVHTTLAFLQRWRAGEEHALDDLYHRVSPLLRARIEASSVFAPLSTVFSVDDVLQETWTRVLAARAEFSDLGPGSFAAWLGCVADRTLITLSRQHHAAKRGHGRSADQLDSNVDQGARLLPGAAHLPSPTSAAKANEFVEFARAVLPERELQAWSWIVVHGYSSEEAALGMSVSAAAVRSLMVRSRRRLQQALTERRGAKEEQPR